MWNCGGGFIGKLLAILDSCGDADIIILLETHLPGDASLPDVPGYRVWSHSRVGAQRASGGIAVLVHERLAAHVSLWASPTTPYHLWVRLGAAAGLQRPLFLAACYLPPFRSKYGLRSAQQLEDYFTGLGDEVAAAMADPGGADVLLAGDLNAHIGGQQEVADYCGVMQSALCEAAEEVLVPCASNLPLPIPPRTSSCAAPVCQQGKALLQLCNATGLRVLNGRLPGDELGSPTCFSGPTPSVIDLLLASAGLLPQASRLRVLDAIPDYQVHRPLELTLALSTPGASASAVGGLSPPASPGNGEQQPAAAADGAAFGPQPTFQPGLRLKEELMPHYTCQLQQPAMQEQLEAVAALAGSDAEAAAVQLHTTLYKAAATVFPKISTTPHHDEKQQRQQRQRQLPWFDHECRAARERLRQCMAANRNSHLSREAVRVLSSKYNLLRKRKAAIWRRQQGTSLLRLHRTDPRAFFKRWKQKAGGNPISAAKWLQHFVNLQRQRVFKPSRQSTAAAQAAQAASPATATATAEGASPLPPHSPPTAPSPSPAAVLDRDWTADDVHQALGKLSPSSSCLGPLKAMLIKAGAEVLAPVLATLFTAVFRSGRVPREWLLGAITAIHKKNDPGDPNNYRGITVGHVLGKLYALMLNCRLTAWTEDSGVRARGQAGFRQGFRTTDNCFVLRAVVERARAAGTKLYVCAVDLEKAFDSVDRPLLWAALQRAGIEGYMLASIQALYADVPVCVKTADGLSQTFQSTLGVKQGCPLSPLLFGLLLDDFEEHVQRSVCPALAQLPLLAGRPVPPLLFADDMLLFSTSPAGLNAQLAALQTYCEAKKLTVNAAKTQVMIMRPGGGGGCSRLAAGEVFSYAGQPLEVVPATKYLGLTFAQLSKRHGFACCAEELAAAGRRALFAVRRRARELGACAVEHQLQLFDIFVQPILSYGCEVWGVDLLGQPDSAPERVHRWFGRRLLGLPQSATSAVVLAELGRWPLHVHWVRQLVRFWNRMLSMDEPDRLVKLAFEDNLALMREGADLAAGSPCWCRKWFRFLQSAPTATGTLVWLTELQEEAVVERAKEAYLAAAVAPREEAAAADGDSTAAARSTGSSVAAAASPVDSGLGSATGTPPDSLGSAGGVCCPHQAGACFSTRVGSALDPPPTTTSGAQGGGLAGSQSLPYTPAATAAAATATNKFAFYMECVRDHTPLGELAPHLFDGAVRDSQHRASLIHFRCSAHNLRVERDRHLPGAVRPPRHLRTCLHCASSVVEDEHHMVFDCPLYDHLRFEFADLFTSPSSHDLQSFLLHENQDRIAQFIHSCYTLRCTMA